MTADPWGELVLPDDVLDDLRLVADWARASVDGGLPERSTGPTVVFAGPAGTGKTATARAAAAAAGVPLFRVDHGQARPLRPYLARLFQAAAARGAALLLDGALIPAGGAAEDRIAATVRDGLRSHPGLAVLEVTPPPELHPALGALAATRIHFSLPGTDERAELWRRALPDGDELDAEVLREAAKRAFTGHQIRMAAGAAVAVAGDAPVGPEAVRRACALIGGAQRT